MREGRKEVGRIGRQLSAGVGSHVQANGHVITHGASVAEETLGRGLSTWYTYLSLYLYLSVTCLPFALV